MRTKEVQCVFVDLEKAYDMVLRKIRHEKVGSGREICEDSKEFV